MARLRSPEEAAEKARAKQLAKVRAAEKRREERAAEKQRAKDSARLFKAHCMDAAKQFADGDPCGAGESLDAALRLIAAMAPSERDDG